MFAPLLDVEMSFRVAGARDCAPCQKCQKWAKREGFVPFPKTMAGVGHLKRTCKDAFSVAGAVQETCSSEMLIGPGAHFLRQVPFWSMRSSVCAALNAEGVEKSQNALIRGRQLCTQLSIIEGSLAELLCFLMLSTWKIADVFVTFKNWGHLKELLHFWCCQVQKLTKSRRIASFSNLSFSNDNYNYNYNCDHATLHTLRYTNYTTLQLQLEIQQQLLLH